MHADEPGSSWRIRREVLQGRELTREFLAPRWQRELDYHPSRGIWGRRDNRIAVRFASECQDDAGKWDRGCGNENCEFGERGVWRIRMASIDDASIRECGCRNRWPLRRRPDHRPSLSDLGF